MNKLAMIRPATAADGAALSELAIATYTAAFGHSFSPADLAAHVQTHLGTSSFERMIATDTVLVAEAERLMVGFIQFGPATAGSAASPDQEIRRLYVLPAFQNAGIGTLLLNSALAHPQLKTAANVYLDVWEHNHGAQRFYRRFGFDGFGARTFGVESGAGTSLDLLMIRRAT